MHTINRRLLINSGAAALSAQVIPIFAQTANMDKEKLPFRSINLPGESKSVAIFFDFSCHFCAKYHPTLIRWIATVPKTVRVYQYPIVNVADKHSLNEQLKAAKCFYAAASVCTTSQLQTFVSVIYEARQNFVGSMGAVSFSGAVNTQVSPLSQPSTWINAAKIARLNESVFHRLVTSNGTTELAKLAAKKLIEYSILETPSIGIGGRYVLTPNSANGDEEMFFNLLNGLVSEII